jgi:long-chain fatty acid transport protein
MYPSGFQINENGARAMAMAGAFTGLANDPSAIYFNPAGITQLDGIQIYAGATMIIPTESFTGPTPYSTAKTDMNSQTFFPINFYITDKITDRLSVGLGINNQFGLGTKWDPSWPGSHAAVETSVKTFFFTPVLAYKVTDNLSLSAGITIATGTVLISTMNTGAAASLPDYLLTLNSKTATAVGFTAAILFKPVDKLQFGASFRSESKFSFTGTATSNPATFPYPIDAQGHFIQLSYPTGDISAPLNTPPDLTVGVAWMPCEKWTITADYQWIGWSTYDSLKISFSTYKAPGTNTLVTKAIPRKYNDTYILRLGSEYKASDVLALRAGVYYDHNPVPANYVEPELPDADRIGINIGAGYNLTNKLRVDLAYELLLFPDRVVTNSVFRFNGTYSNMASLIGLDLSYNF